MGSNKKRILSTSIIILGIIGSIILLFFLQVGVGLYFYIFIATIFLFLFIEIKFRKIGITLAIIWTVCLLYFVYTQKRSIYNVVVLVPKSYEGYIRIGFSSNNADEIKIIKGNALLDMRNNRCTIFQKKYYNDCYNSPLYLSESTTSMRIPDRNILFKQIDTVSSSNGDTYWFNFFLSPDSQDKSKTDINKIIKRYSAQLENCH